MKNRALKIYLSKISLLEKFSRGFNFNGCNPGYFIITIKLGSC
jgi:hypothetical protein